MKLKTLRFLHIPKTAGSSFKNILLREYRGNNYFEFSGDFNNDVDSLNKRIEKNKKILLYLGHAPIQIGITEADNCEIITFLRDPVERVKSFCQHVYEGKSPYLLNDFPPEAFNLNEFLNSGNEELNNLQTKMLINCKSCTDSTLLNSLDSRYIIDIALDNLFNKVKFYGITEFFNESLVLLNSTLKFNKCLFYQTLNTKNKKKQLAFSNENINKIIKLNKFDILLYKQAKIEFFNRINNTTHFNVKLRLLSILQYIYQNWKKI